MYRNMFYVILLSISLSISSCSGGGSSPTETVIGPPIETTATPKLSKPRIKDTGANSYWDNSDLSLKLNWDWVHPSDPDIKVNGFRILYKPEDSSVYLTVADVAADGNKSTFSIQTNAFVFNRGFGVYKFMVAVDTSEGSEHSNEFEITYGSSFKHIKFIEKLGSIPLKHPKGIFEISRSSAVSDPILFIVDTYNHRIAHEEKSGNRTIVDGLSYPFDMTIISISGVLRKDLWVTDTGNNRLIKYTLNDSNTAINFAGEVLSFPFDEPTGITQLGNDKLELYITNSGKNQICKIELSKIELMESEQYIIKDLKFNTTILSATDTQMIYPTDLHALRIGTIDHLAIIDSGSHTLYYFTKPKTSDDSAWTLKNHFGGYGSETKKFKYPSSVMLKQNGAFVDIYISDKNNHRICQFQYNDTNSKINHIETFGIIKGTKKGQFSYPQSVFISSDGKTLYVTERGNNRVQVFTKSD